MSRRPVSIWIRERLKRARWLTLAGAVGLILATVVASIYSWSLIHQMVDFFNVFVFSGNPIPAAVVTSIILLSLFAWELASTWRRSSALELDGHEVSFFDGLLVESASYGSSYGAFMMRRKILYLAIVFWIVFLAPRLLCLSLMLLRRFLALKRLDDNTAERVIATMMKGEFRLTLAEIRERFQPASETELIGGLTALDGVVLIGAETESPALTVAPRLTEDYKDWLAARKERQAAL
ncbi:hypothetical protein GC176_05180 [bacterium]|nr:hypothetical protein [bacterium]